MAEEDYKYKADEGRCKFNKEKVVVKVKGFVKIESNENDIASGLVEYGPLAIGINA